MVFDALNAWVLGFCRQFMNLEIDLHDLIFLPLSSSVIDRGLRMSFRVLQIERCIFSCPFLFTIRCFQIRLLHICPILWFSDSNSVCFCFI